jgi:hypothetical protein
MLAFIVARMGTLFIVKVIMLIEWTAFWPVDVSMRFDADSMWDEVIPSHKSSNDGSMARCFRVKS